MAKWLKVCMVVALLLVGAGAFSFYQFEFVPPAGHLARQAQANAARQAAELRLAQRRRAFEECRESVQLVYDVHWAAACMGQAGQAFEGQADGDAECDLPNAKAAVVNAWLNEEEARCEAEARAGSN